jgi:hypothetical protein
MPQVARSGMQGLRTKNHIDLTGARNELSNHGNAMPGNVQENQLA